MHKDYQSQEIEFTNRELHSQSLFSEIEMDSKGDGIDQQEGWTDNIDSQKIDEQILTKTSELHQSLRNKRLLQFQLIQSSIMKKANLQTIKAIQIAVELSKYQKEKLKVQNDEIQTEILESQHLIKQGKAHFRSTLQKYKKIQKRQAQNTILLKNVMSWREMIRINKREDQFVQIQMIKQEISNTSSKEVIEALKKEIESMRANIKIKEAQQQQIQEQYQIQLIKVKKLQINLKKNKRREIRRQKQQDKLQLSTVVINQSKDKYEKQQNDQPLPSQITFHQENTCINTLSIPTRQQQPLKTLQDQPTRQQQPLKTLQDQQINKSIYTCGTKNKEKKGKTEAKNTATLKKKLKIL